MKIWERYLLKEFLKFVLFFLFAFYLFYVFVDFSTHVTDFIHGKHISFGRVLKYYGLQFIKRCDLLLPLATLIGAIKVLCQLNTHKELVALLSAGISLKRLLRPLIATSCAFCLVNVFLNEYALPQSLQFIDKFYDAHIGHRFRGNRSDPLRVMHLDDHSKLVFQYYDAAREAFFDVVWLENADSIWRMKHLKADPDTPHGEYVDHLTRNAAGGFEKSESYSSYVFLDISWSKDLPQRGYIPFENRSIRELSKLLREPSLSLLEARSALTQLLFKLSMPLLSILALIAVVPYCVQSNRALHQFFIYGFSIFGFVSFVALLDAAVIVGESATLSPFLAILFPFAAIMGVFGYRFVKLR